jgi:hypothetical protein
VCGNKVLKEISINERILSPCMDRRAVHASRTKELTNTLKILLGKSQLAYMEDLNLKLNLILNIILDKYAVRSGINLRQNSVWWLLS